MLLRRIKIVITRCLAAAEKKIAGTSETVINVIIILIDCYCFTNIKTK